MDTGREIETVISLLLAETEEVARLKRELRKRDRIIEKLQEKIKKMRRGGGKMSVKTKWEGLWKSRTAVYNSKAILKKDIQKLPAKCRLIVRENIYHKNNEDGTPRFVYTFADAEAASAITLELEDYSGIMEEIERVHEMTKEILNLSIRGQDVCSNYDRVYHTLADIEDNTEIILNMLSKIISEAEKK